MSKSNSNKGELSRIHKYLDSKRAVRAALLNATEAVREMQTIQDTWPIATMMVGRSMVGAALLASHLKDGEVVSLYFRGDGPIERVFAEASYDGGVRGYVSQPHVDLPFKDGRLDLPSAIGRGHLTVVRTHPQRSQPHSGTVELQSGEIGDDITYYLQQSQQVRSALAVGVKLNEHGKVEAAGGILIELLPGADAHVEVIVEDQFRRAGSISEAFARGETPEHIVDRYLGGFDMKKLEHPCRVTYTCKCSRERLLNSMELFNNVDLDDMIQKKEPIVAKCEFCGRQYSLDWTEISDVRKQRLKSGVH